MTDSIIQFSTNQEVQIQRQYYAKTASKYDDMHTDPQHILGLYLLAAYIEFYQIKSILDVGAGTGSSILYLKQRFPDIKIVGIEPVSELRDQGYKKGLSFEDLQNGDAYHLPFADNSFELVCEFAVLHHVKFPNQVATEMSRVASRMVCISDCNFMGQGSLLLRLLKRLLFSMKLWSFANFLKTKGKGYTISEEDGLAYSYSVYQSLATIQKLWDQVQIIKTQGTQSPQLNTLLSAEQLMLIAQDKR